MDIITLILEEAITAPGGTTTIRRVEVTGDADQVGGLLAGQRLPMLPEPTPEPACASTHADRPKPKLRTWDDCLPEILWRQERIGQRQAERAHQAQKTVCMAARGLLRDFYEMIGGE